VVIAALSVFFLPELMMTQTQWDDIYTSLYEVYEKVSLKDEQVRSTIGDALDRMIDINPRNKN
jgi:hypothetical protein